MADDKHVRACKVAYRESNLVPCGLGMSKDMPFQVFRNILREWGITDLSEKLVYATRDNVSASRVAVDEFIESDDLVHRCFFKPEYKQGRPYRAERRRCHNEVEDGIAERGAPCTRLNFSL